MKSGTHSSFGHTNYYCIVYILGRGLSVNRNHSGSRHLIPIQINLSKIIHHPNHPRSVISTFVSVVYRLSLVHIHSFVWRAIFVRINQGTHQGWMPQFQNWNSIKKIKYFTSEMGKKKKKKQNFFFFPFMFFDTNLLNFYSFF